ncbi:MAG TPA: DUF559 domain-containing protein [Aurantimonas coralicida]|uniref:DUF559 domain-containing protein n=1 Tax=Aurantimonas coralicida TaxID=182270 RepID=A0A9C9TI50_9HYPH|nr:DUF559 domain-containing protein [Aurantimonas coralicida]HEU02012.1 DUF559 domain-containing protein [Aurantimonas coralicida]
MLIRPSHIGATRSPVERRPELDFVRQGCRVLRLWNDAVRYERDAVLDTIFAVVEERRQLRDDR